MIDDDLLSYSLKNSTSASVMVAYFGFLRIGASTAWPAGPDDCRLLVVMLKGARTLDGVDRRIASQPKAVPNAVRRRETENQYPFMFLVSDGEQRNVMRVLALSLRAYPS